MSTGNPPAGYYADPSVPGYIRYWDGSQWVSGTSRPAPEEVADQVLASSQPGAAAPSGGAHARPAAEPSQSGESWQPQAGGGPQDAAPSATGSGRSAPQQYAHPPQQAQQQFDAQQLQAQQQFQTQQQAQQQQLQAQQQQLQAQQQQQLQAEQQAQARALLAQQQLQQLQAPPQAQPQPPVPAQQQPTAQPVSVAPQIAESVSTMVVPSAFGGRGNTNHYGFSYDYADPFAGLPGSSPMQRPDEEREVETQVVELATPGSRILARIIDLGIAAGASSPITVSLLLLAHRHDHQYVLHLDAQATTTYTTLGMDGVGIGLWAGALLTLILTSLLLESYRLGRGGQSFGKQMAGIRVVQLSDGTPLTRRGKGTRRSLLFWVFAVLPLIDVLTLGGALWGRPYRQGAHERLTSTVTVKA